MRKTTKSTTAPTRRNGKPSEGTWNFKLYIAGNSPRSQAALKNLRKLCDQYLRGVYDIEIVDLVENPQLAKIDQVLAIPTLVRRLPVPVKRVIGDLSNADRAMLSLEFPPPGATVPDSVEQ